MDKSNTEVCSSLKIVSFFLIEKIHNLAAEDAYLDTLEIWQRFNVEQDFHSIEHIDEKLLNNLKIIIGK